MIFCVRNPIDIAKSLKHRDNTNEVSSLSLYKIYIEDFLKNISDTKCIFSHYDLMLDKKEYLQRLINFINIPGLKINDNVENFITKKLRHNIENKKIEDEKISDLYSILLLKVQLRLL